MGGGEKRYLRGLTRVILVQKEQGEDNCGCGLWALGGRYNDFAFSLKRHRQLPTHKCGGCIMGKEAMEDGLHILWRSSSKAGRDFILEEYRRLVRYCKGFCQHCINKVLKKRTAMLNMGVEYIHNQW